MSHSSPTGLPSTDVKPGRRTFLQRLMLWGTIAAGALATIALSIPLVGYLLGALFKREKDWVRLGPIDQFPPGETKLKTFTNPLSQPWDGMVAHTGCFVRYLGKDEQQQPQFLVFAVNCAHLGCPVSWFPQSGLFMCPCHGGVYYKDGSVAAGPPPKPLFRYDVRIKDNEVQVKAAAIPITTTV